MVTAALLMDFSGLVEAHQPRLLALARRLVWDSEEARDVLQFALADAWARRASLKDPAAAPAWLRRIVVHRAISVLRRRRLFRAVGALFLVEPEPAPVPDEQLSQAQHLSGLGTALEKLPARQAAAFSLRYLEGLSFEEVASALGCEKGTARVHVQRAVTALRLRGVLPKTEVKG